MKVFAAVALVVGLLGCGSEAGRVATGARALSAEQCDHFAAGGKVTICHATGSATNPIVMIRVAENACVSAHSAHAGDSVAVDGDCGPNAVLGVGAPCDGTRACVSGSSCEAGVCTSAREDLAALEKDYEEVGAETSEGGEESVEEG